MQGGLVRQGLGGPVCLTLLPLLSRVQVAFSLPVVPYRQTLGAGRNSKIDQDKGGEGQCGMS